MVTLQLYLIFLISPSFFDWFARGNDKCTLCLDGGPVPSPNNMVYDADSGYNETCEYHNNFVGMIFPPGSTYCNYAQTGALYLCNCKIPEDKCKLCHDDSPVVNVKHEIDVMASVFDSSKAGTMLDTPMSCKHLWANLGVHIEAGTETCWDYQHKYSLECGCKSSPPPPMFENNLENNFTLSNNETMNTIVEESSSSDYSDYTCKLCASDEPMLYPNRTFEFDIFNYINRDQDIAGFTIKTCFDLDFWISILPGVPSEVCSIVEMMSSYCGCKETHKFDETCTLCPNGKPPRNPLKTVNWNDKKIYHHMSFHLPVEEFNCGMFDAIMRNYDEDKMGISEGQYCLFAHLRSNYCGCDVDWKPIIITWSFRISGILSLLGSSFVIYCVFHKKRLQSTYHQLLLGLSIFDVLGSIMYILCTTLTPVEDGMSGAMGNRATCQMQGFFFQLGLTSAFFNALLSLYFYLMICKNWKERKFQQYRTYAYVFVTVIGLALAFSGINFYYTDMLYMYCYIRPPPAEKSYLPIMLWNVVPIAFVFLFMSVNTGLLVYAVYKQHKASNKWNFRGSQNSTRSRRESWNNFRASMTSIVSRRSSTDFQQRRNSNMSLNSDSGRSGYLSRSSGRRNINKTKKSVFHRVLWQSIYYLLSYTLTLPILMLRSLVHLTDNEYMKTAEALFMWNVLVAILCPAQGIFNAMIFYNRENSSKKSKKKKKDSTTRCESSWDSFLVVFSSCKKDDKGGDKKDKKAGFGETPSVGFTQNETRFTETPSVTFAPDTNGKSAEIKTREKEEETKQDEDAIKNDVENNENCRRNSDLSIDISEVRRRNSDLSVDFHDETEYGHEAALEFLELTKGDGKIDLFGRRRRDEAKERALDEKRAARERNKPKKQEQVLEANALSQE